VRAASHNPEKFYEAFTALRRMLASCADNLLVTADQPGNYQVSSCEMKDRAGNPLFIAAVRTGKAYVSYHFMPVYMNPALQKQISPALQKRMQGKSCFNFTEPPSAARIEELATLTRTGLQMFRNLKLPWDQPKSSPKRTAARP
jgi:hypothetical protein